MNLHPRTALFLGILLGCVLTLITTAPILVRPHVVVINHYMESVPAPLPAPPVNLHSA